MDIVDQAIEAAGGVAKTARALGMSHSSVINWRKVGRIPAERVLAVERLTGLPRERLRPDLYPAVTAADRR